MKTRFTNARILSMEENKDIFAGELEVTDDRITYVGPERENVWDSFDRIIDCNGNLLMPGFKNAHTHSGMSVFRSMADDLPLDRWLNESIFPREAMLSAEDIKWSTKLSVLEYLTSGVTGCFDMYLTPESICEAMDECGFRCAQVSAMNNFSQSLELQEKMYNLLSPQKDSLQTYFVGLHAEYTNSIELIKGVSELVHKYQTPAFLHLAETELEVKGCIERYGKTPLQLMESVGLFDYGGGIYHGVWMDEQDMEILQRRKLFVVTNPSSNIKLASGIAPIKSYLDRKIRVAIGTDGPASNNCLDMFREMFLVTALAKYRENDAAVVDALDVLKMATVNGALCMGLNDCDVLSEGKKADIIMIDMHMPNMQPENNIAKNLVYSGSKSNIKLTMVNGKILYENGQFFINEDPERIYSEVTAVRDRLIKNG